MMDEQSAGIDESTALAGRSWEQQTAYHRRRAEQERGLAARAPDGPSADAHRTLADRHEMLASAAELASAAPESIPPVAVEKSELIARAAKLISPRD